MSKEKPYCSFIALQNLLARAGERVRDEDLVRLDTASDNNASPEVSHRRIKSIDICFYDRCLMRTKFSTSCKLPETARLKSRAVVMTDNPGPSFVVAAAFKQSFWSLEMFSNQEE